MDISKDNSKQKWLLSHPERRFLDNKDTQNSSKRHKNIQQHRLPNLGNRIQRLIDDLALLDKGGYLDYEENPLGTVDTNFNPRISERDRDVWCPCYPPERQHNESLGLSLGQVTRSITSAAWPSIDYNEIVWSFIWGLLGRKRKFEAEFQYDVRQLVEFIEERQKHRTELVNLSPVSPRRIEEVIAKSGHVASKKVPPIHEEIFRIRSDTLQYEPENISPNIMEAIEFSVSETREFLLFDDYLRQYTTGITDTRWNGIGCEEVFYEVWLAANPVSSTETKKKYNSRNKDKIPGKRTVSKILADLAGQDRNQRHLAESVRWNENPIIKEIDSNKRRGRKWNTTPYGDVIGRWAFEEESGRETIRRNIARLLINGNPRTQIQQKIKLAVENWDRN